MIFEVLKEAADRNELILIDGGFCRFHIRKDGQLIIHEILSIKKGAGNEILKILERKQCFCIVAKCPIDLEANKWYEKKGFKLIGIETSSKRHLNIWSK